ncbi:MAG: hypothetical protein IIB06_07635 [Bacteroidetes bacterium]|nr:hypothetical protein [Bacteroidota bacterium]
MKNIYIFLIIVLSFESSFTQVGINTTTPSATLEVIGDVKLDSSLYLESPGNNIQIRGSKLLIRSTANEILKYDITISKYGPINYAEFSFNDLSTYGLYDYDTKISTADYIVCVEGYRFHDETPSETSVMPHSLIYNYNIEGYQIYAYENTTTQTWWMRAFVNNSEFMVRQGSGYDVTTIDMILNIIIYRRGFIAKSLTPINVDMGAVDSGTAPLPTGF